MSLRPQKTLHLGAGVNIFEEGLMFLFAARMQAGFNVIDIEPGVDGFIQIFTISS